MCTQSRGIGVRFRRAFSHVLFTNLIDVFPRFTFVAVILSSVNLRLMALYHLDVISSVECEASLITRSHLSTHIRCADSEISICRKLSIPFLLFFLWVLSSSSSSPRWLPSSSSGVVRLPQPRIEPMVISSHCSGSCGQVSWASCHIVLTGSDAQVVRM